MRNIADIPRRVKNVYRRLTRQRPTAKDKWNDELKEIWAGLSFPPDKLQFVLHLYRKYCDDLEEVKNIQAELFDSRENIGLVPQLCDLEAEITYLLIREYKPGTIIEISPASGWSTTWILHALRDNKFGKLYSFDLVDDSTRVVPAYLAEERWQFHQGDIKENLHLLPVKADYLFIDSDHSAEFANWYINTIFPRYPKGTKVSVHDILKWSQEPGWGEESLVLCAWLAKNQMPCVTASRIMRDKGYDQIRKLRQQLLIDEGIQKANYNSMIYFEL